MVPSFLSMIHRIFKYHTDVLYNARMVLYNSLLQLDKKEKKRRLLLQMWRIKHVYDVSNGNTPIECKGWWRHTLQQRDARGVVTTSLSVT